MVKIGVKSQRCHIFENGGSRIFVFLLILSQDIFKFFGLLLISGVLSADTSRRCVWLAAMHADSMVNSVLVACSACGEKHISTRLINRNTTISTKKKHVSYDISVLC
jgi:hypothetical protein